MHFFGVARVCRHPDDAISLRDVWTIADGELNEIAGIACARLQNEEELTDLHREVAWASQALIWRISERQSFLRRAAPVPNVGRRRWPKRSIFCDSVPRRMSMMWAVPKRWPVR